MLPRRPSSSLPSSLLALAAAPLLAAGYSWDYATVPTQCGDLELKITGSDGKPPYSALIIPYNGSPLSNEVRHVTLVPFNDSSSVKFQFRFPANSQFVLTVRSYRPGRIAHD
jgi:hypothetical protein